MHGPRIAQRAAGRMHPDLAGSSPAFANGDYLAARATPFAAFTMRSATAFGCDT